MKAPFLSLTALILVVSISAHSKYQDDAKLWIKTYLQSDDGTLLISSSDAQMLLNLTYFSYLRSKATLSAQETGVQAITQAWHGWQNIAQTRLDPSRKLPFAVDLDAQVELFAQFIEAQRKHRKIGRTYSHAVSIIIENDILTSTATPFAIDRMRNQARSVVLDAFTDIKQQVALLLSEKRTGKKLKRQKGFLQDAISTFLPAFALSTFLKLDTCYVKSSAKTWDILENVQQASALLYRTIEQERAAFYKAYYQALYQIAKASKFKNSYFMIAFDENGLIAVSGQTQRLPVLS